MNLSVLEVLPTLKRAGAERVAVSLATGLRAHGCDTHLVSLYDAFPGGFEEALGTAAVPVHHLSKRRGLDLRMVPRLRAIFAQTRPAIIHTHSYLLRYVLPAWQAWPGARIVHTVHNVALREVDLLGRLIHRWAFHKGVVPVAVGEEVADSFQQVYGRPVATTIPNGIELECASQPGQGQAWRQRHGFDQSDRLAVCVARLEPQKNHTGLVEAFHQAFPANSSWRLLLIGDGSLRPQLESQIAALGLQQRVHLLGLQPEVAAVLAAADLFVLASQWEGAPLAIMEALAAGVPVVATSVGGLPNLVRHGEDGLLVPPDHPGALAGAIRSLATDDARRQAMGHAASQHATRFGSEAMVAAYARLFHQLAGGST